MENYLIPPDDCLLLKAFKDTQSLREAAILLQCDPAGLTRRVQHISSTYGLIQKVNNRWQLTSGGIDLVAWTEMSIQSQKKLILGKSSLRIASTMWLAEELLIPNFNKLKKVLENLTFSFSVPNKGFEQSLIEGSVDFVITCHAPENPEIEHKKLGHEEWVIITPPSWGNKAKTIESLRTLPFIRHSDLNTDLFIPEISEDIQQTFISIDNLIGIRTAVIEGFGWSVVPRLLVEKSLKKQLLVEVPYSFSMTDRNVCLWWLRNRYDSRKISSKISSWLKEIC